jgi:hypothetical protein
MWKFSLTISLMVFIQFSGTAQERSFEVDFKKPTDTGSPYVFGATQPRGLSEKQWDQLQEHGFTLARSQADVTNLVPCSSPEDYDANVNGCADPENWDWQNGIYGEDFVSKAAARNMRVILTYKNARWNRHEGTPSDEETIPKDFEVWQDILTKIIDHYQGAINYLELYNEVDRDPQLLVENSGLSRKEAYQKILRTAVTAVKNSKHPDLKIGGPAAALIGEEQVVWMLEDPGLRKNIGMISFHDFDNPEFPLEAVETYRKLIKKYKAKDIALVRSSFVPEYEREKRLPGTLFCSPVAHHLIGALNHGVAAMGLWEIQNKTDEDDVRYWFDGNKVVNTASLYRMMSGTLKLGQGESKIYSCQGPGETSCLAAQNAAGDYLVVIADDLKGAGFSGKITVKGLPAEKKSLNTFKAGERHDGESNLSQQEIATNKGAVTINFQLGQFEVAGFLFTSEDEKNH